MGLKKARQIIQGAHQFLDTEQYTLAELREEAKNNRENSTIPQTEPAPADDAVEETSPEETTDSPELLDSSETDESKQPEE